MTPSESSIGNTTPYVNVVDDELSPSSFRRNMKNNPSTNNTGSSALSVSFAMNTTSEKGEQHQQHDGKNNDTGGLILFTIHFLIVLATAIFYISYMIRIRHDESFLEQYDESYIIEYWDNIIPYCKPWYLSIILLVPILIMISLKFLLDQRTCKSFLDEMTIIDVFLYIGSYLVAFIFKFHYLALWFVLDHGMWGENVFKSTMIDIATTILQPSQKAVVILIYYAYLHLSFTYLWSYMLWKTLVAAYFVHHSDPENVDTIIVFIFIFFCLSSMWTFRVFTNVIHVMTASIVGSICLSSSSSSPDPTAAVSLQSSLSQVHASHKRSVGTLFGTICTGWFTDCIELTKVICCCRENDIIFSHWVFIFVGIDGTNYNDSERNVRNLLKVEHVYSNTLGSLHKVDLSMIGTAIGYTSAFYIVLMKFIFDPPSTEDYIVAVALVPLLFGSTMTMTILNIIETTTRTIILCYYRSPNEFQTNYPQLYERMTDILPRYHNTTNNNTSAVSTTIATAIAPTTITGKGTSNSKGTSIELV